MAYLGTKPANAVLTSEQIGDGVITTADLANGAITDAKIASMAANKLTGQLPDANAPSGSVIQVVNVQYGTGVSTTSTSYVDTGLSASITPISASSKILVIVSQTITPSSASSAGFASVRLMRGASQIWMDARVNAIGQFVHTTPNAFVLDSPATTSSVTYKTQFATGSSSFTIEAQHADLRTSTITLMEIAA
jgi:hypothetical protein